MDHNKSVSQEMLAVICKPENQTAQQVYVMNIMLQGTNLDISDELRTFTIKKIGDSLLAVGNLNLDPVRIDIELEKTTRSWLQERKDEQLYRAEANVSLPGQKIRVESSAMEIEQAIIQLKHMLTRKFRKHRERRIGRVRKGARKAKSMAPSDHTPEEDR